MQLRNIRTITAVATIALLAACADPRLDKLALGISPDSATRVIGAAPHRTNPYLMASKQWTVQFYARAAADPKDSIPWRKMSPVVFIDGKAVGWGWGWWSGASVKNGIGMPK